jgi:hypothetical protein
LLRFARNYSGAQWPVDSNHASLQKFNGIPFPSTTFLPSNRDLAKRIASDFAWS